MTGPRVADTAGPAWEVAVPAGAELGERPVWDAADRCLIWVDILAGELHRYLPAGGGEPRPGGTGDADVNAPPGAPGPGSAWSHGGAGRDRVVVSAGVAVGAAAPRRGGGYVLAAADGFRLLRADGSADGPPLRPADMGEDVGFNDGACDPAGRFWAGTATLDGSPGGALYRLDPDRTITRVFGGVTESNGLGWSPDQSAFYYIDSGADAPTVRKYACDLFSGKISGESELIAFAPADRIPDGLVVDSAGCLWIAMWGGGCVRRYSPAGELLAIWPVPVSQPTCPGFGGAGLDHLYLTTAWQDLDGQRRDAEPLAGHLLVTRPGVTGLALAPYGG